MRVRDAMTPDVQLCTPEDTLRDAAEAISTAMGFPRAHSQAAAVSRRDELGT